MAKRLTLMRYPKGGPTAWIVVHTKMREKPDPEKHGGSIADNYNRGVDLLGAAAARHADFADGPVTVVLEVKMDNV